MKNKVIELFSLQEKLDLYLNIQGYPYLYIEKNAKNDDLEDKQIEQNLLEDIDALENETVEEKRKRIKRYQRIVKILKERYQFKCQICGQTFQMDNGNWYCEAHHIKSLSNNGSQSAQNVIILCAHHHRMFHYAGDTISMGNQKNGFRIMKIGQEEYDIPFI